MTPDVFMNWKKRRTATVTLLRSPSNLVFFDPILAILPFTAPRSHARYPDSTDMPFEELPRQIRFMKSENLAPTPARLNPATNACAMTYFVLVLSSDGSIVSHTPLPRFTWVLSLVTRSASTTVVNPSTSIRRACFSSRVDLDENSLAATALR